MTMSLNLNRGVWTAEEHDRFLEAIQIYPHGPWRYVAKHVETRDVRQVQTHAQKYYEKVGRHMRGLRKERRSWVRSEHRIDDLPPGLQRSTIPPPEERVGKRFNVSPSPSLDEEPAKEVKVEATRNQLEDAKEEEDDVEDDDEEGEWISDDSEGGDESPRRHDGQAHAGLPSDLPSLEESLDILLSCLSDY